MFEVVIGRNIKQKPKCKKKDDFGYTWHCALSVVNENATM